MVIIRTDASSTIGSGHVMRCLTLAHCLRLRGASVVFAMRPLTGNLIARVRDNGFPVLEIGRHFGDAPMLEEVDADLCIAAIRTNGPLDDAAAAACASWLIVDHYGLGQQWESRSRHIASRLLAVDDLANRVHDVDVLLDQNLVEDFPNRYNGLVSDTCVKLLGPDYALIAARYRDVRRHTHRDGGKIRSILVYFGGADREMTLMAVDALSRLPFDFSARIILDSANPQADLVQRKSAADGRLSVSGQLPDLAQAMAEADLFVGASGTTSWERLALGLNAVVVTLADNQEPLARKLEREGFITWLGRSETISADALLQGLRKVLAAQIDPDTVTRMMQVVDGLGTERVADVMMFGGGSGLELRLARPSDSDIVLSWANDPVTRRNAFNGDQISGHQHEPWFDRRICSPDVVFYLAETPGGIPAGQVRFERQSDQAWEISYLVAPIFRARGIARPMLDAAIGKLFADPDKSLVSGYVKPENTASVRVFKALGFGIAARQDRATAVRYELARPD